MSVRSDFGRLHWDVSCDFDGEEGEGGGGGSVERGACYGPTSLPNFVFWTLAVDFEFLTLVSNFEF